MNKLGLKISIVVLASLLFGLAGVGYAGAVSPSGPAGNQVFYSTGVQDIVTGVRSASVSPDRQFYSAYIGSFVKTYSTSVVHNQIFYSPFVGSIVSRASMSLIPNQVFYSQYVANMINPTLPSGFPNQVFYSPTIEGFLH